RERTVGAAIQNAAVLDGFQCLSGRTLRCDGEQQCKYRGKSLHVTVPSNTLGRCGRFRDAQNSVAGAGFGSNDYRFLALSSRWPPISGISERSDCRVRGLTLAFCADVYVCRANFAINRMLLSHVEEAQRSDKKRHPPRHLRP